MAALNTKKVLLVHPLGYSAQAAGKDISRIANIMPPLGLASLAAYMEREGIKSAIIDCYARPDSNRLIRDHLLTEKPAGIGFSCTTSSFLDGIRIARMAKAILPGLKVVFGGPHVSALRERIPAQFPEIDFAVIGEGEQTLTELILSEYEQSPEIQGIVYREPGDEIHVTGNRSGIKLDALPFPAYDKLEGFPKAYLLPIFNYPRSPNTSCISSRGCPYGCSYCDRSVFGSSFRFNSAEYLYAHLHYLKDRFGIRHVNFYDDLFTLNRRRVEDFTRMMVNQPLGITFNCAVRAEHIDADLLKQMRDAGCWMISLGIETGDPVLLSQHRSHADLDRVAEAVGLIKQAGIRVKGLLMMGLPGETAETIRKSMRFVSFLHLDDFNLTKFTPFPGSPLYERIREWGKFEEIWEKMDCMHFVFVPKGMTRDTLEKRFKAFYKKHFLRPRTLMGYAGMLWRSPESWIRFLKNLTGFIRFAKSNKRLGGS